MLTTTEIIARWKRGDTLSPRRALVRRGALATADAVLLAVAASGAFLLGLSPTDDRMSVSAVAVTVAVALALKLPLMYVSGVYHVQWRRSDIRDMAVLGRALVLSSAAFTAVALLLSATGAGPDTAVRLLFLDFLLSVLTIAGLRAILRMSGERSSVRAAASKTPVLIVGAGDAGTQVARALRKEPAAPHKAVGYIDDDPAKQGMIINGLRVLGTRSELSAAARKFKGAELWIAMPSIRGQAVREIVEAARAAGFTQIKVVPGLGALLSGQVRLGDIREVRLEELLGRAPVRINNAEVSQFLRGRRVLVTGAAGSIGSELCAQIAQFGPAVLIAFDQDETGIFNVKRSLHEANMGLAIEGVVGDVRDRPKVESVFKAHRPEVVFHAAAYKHVPLMEEHPEQAARTNILGTHVVAEAARAWHAARFVLISTDKAVNPTSIMGATKRAAELVVQEVGRGGPTDYVAVRFGNVLGSRGSVVPIFREQILRGGPVTITDPEMRRYFMTIEEAVLLVLQAAAIGENGQVLVLDMGEPVRIVDLARQLISLAGLEPDRDIPIVFTGIRPGEKLFEDILTAEEGTSATVHDRIFVARASPGHTAAQFTRAMAELEMAVGAGSREAVVAGITGLVSNYRRNTLAASAAPSAPGSSETRPVDRAAVSLTPRA
jgi:FlaA1/EpsC-like NDP-sugar epimerase